MEPIEDYGIVGDLQTAALIGRSGSVDWLCFPRFDSVLVLRRAAREPRERPLADRARRGRACDLALLPREHARPGERVDDVDRPDPRDRLHAAAPEGAGHRSHRRGVGGSRRDAHRADDPVRLRLGDTVGAAPRRRDPARTRRPGRGHRPHARRPAAARHVAHRALRRAGGRARPVRPDVVPVERAAPDAGRSGACAAGDGDLLARVDERLRLPRRVSRGSAQLTADAEGADVRADRRHRRRADDVAARADRRRTQLGLPLLLVARRDLHALRADERGLHRRGARVAQLAAARRCRRPGEGADPLRRRWAAPHPRVRARLASRLRGLAAGAHRQRGARPVPARRLRRGDGRPAPGRARTGCRPTTTHGRCSGT